MRIMSALLFLVATAGLASCQHPHTVESASEPDTCGMKNYNWIVGEDYKRMPVAPAGKVIRIVCSTCPMTMDYNESRLNVIYEESTGVVSRLNCG